VRNEEECVCSVCLFRCNIVIGVRIIKEMPVSVVSGTLCIKTNILKSTTDGKLRRQNTLHHMKL
jgi:hypothetical protein